MVEIVGDQDSAQTLRSDAQGAVRTITERTGDEDLRQTFMSQPRIRSIMEPKRSYLFGSSGRSKINRCYLGTAGPERHLPLEYYLATDISIGGDRP